jgi:hypothetical protein
MNVIAGLLSGIMLTSIIVLNLLLLFLHSRSLTYLINKFPLNVQLALLSLQHFTLLFLLFLPLQLHLPLPSLDLLGA